MLGIRRCGDVSAAAVEDAVGIVAAVGGVAAVAAAVFAGLGEAEVGVVEVAIQRKRDHVAGVKGCRAFMGVLCVCFQALTCFFEIR